MFQLSTVAGTITITDAAAGEGYAQPLPESTNTLTADVTVYWDLQVARDGSPDETYTVDFGSLAIQRTVTRTAP